MLAPGSAQEEVAHWVRLQQTPGVGPVGGRKLLAAFGLPHNIFAAAPAALRQLVSEQAVQSLTGALPEHIKTLIEKALAWAGQDGNKILTLADSEYPRALLDISDPPLLLYAKGRAELLAQPSIAVVGSRNATTQGCINAERFSEALSTEGFTIVSGMALGIDAAAHRGGLRGTGSTVAVIGTGADIVYPSRNRSLAHEVAAAGCIISEYALGTPASASNFPRRNRIISGLAQGVLVIEAAAQSGSLITARMAAEQGREVFAIPGSIHSPLSKGCHLLIKQGAKLTESADDILEEFQYRKSEIPVSTQMDASAEPASRALLDAIGYDPVAPDTLVQRSDLCIAEINAQLLGLELQGLVEMLPGGMVRRVATP
jgi:DNA processing protein